MKNHLQCFFLLFFYCFIVVFFLSSWLDLFLGYNLPVRARGCRVSVWVRRLTSVRSVGETSRRSRKGRHSLGVAQIASILFPAQRPVGFEGRTKPFGQQRTFFSRAPIFISTSQYIFWMHAVLITTNVAPPLSSDGCSKSTCALEGTFETTGLLAFFWFSFAFFPLWSLQADEWGRAALAATSHCLTKQSSS